MKTTAETATPDSLLPLVRARYERHAETSTPQSLQNAAKAGWMRALPVSRSWPMTSAPARSMRICCGTPPKRGRLRRAPRASRLATGSAPRGRRGVASSRARRRRSRPWCGDRRGRSISRRSQSAAGTRAAFRSAPWRTRRRAWPRGEGASPRRSVRSGTSTWCWASRRCTMTALPTAGPSSSPVPQQVHRLVSPLGEISGALTAGPPGGHALLPRLRIAHAPSCSRRWQGGRTRFMQRVLRSRVKPLVMLPSESPHSHTASLPTLAGTSTRALRKA